MVVEAVSAAPKVREDPPVTDGDARSDQNAPERPERRERRAGGSPPRSISGLQRATSCPEYRHVQSEPDTNEADVTTLRTRVRIKLVPEVCAPVGAHRDRHRQGIAMRSTIGAASRSVRATSSTRAVVALFERAVIGLEPFSRASGSRTTLVLRRR